MTAAIPAANPTFLRMGRGRGFKVEKVASTKARPARRRGALSSRVKVVREIIREVAGLAPYEKRVLDVIKTGGANAEKRSYKLSKQRLGTHTRALRKREELKGLWAKQRARTTA